MTAQPLIRVEDLARYYQMGAETVHALDGIDMVVEAGEFLGVAGPSGSGKSTLLYLLGGLDQPTRGRIWVNGEDIGALDENGLAKFRQKTVGFVFQSFNLIPTMTAVENVAFPMIFARVPRDDRLERAGQLLALVGLGDRLQHKPTELSGGQQQRVSIARSLVNDPAIVLADEPTGNLDSKSGEDVVDILRQLNEDEERTIIMVTHDESLLAVTRRRIHLLDGRILDDMRANNGERNG
jgi:putative ABC transport system ATP-binding protein